MSKHAPATREGMQIFEAIHAKRYEVVYALYWQRIQQQARSDSEWPQIEDGSPEKAMFESLANRVLRTIYDHEGLFSGHHSARQSEAIDESIYDMYASLIRENVCSDAQAHHAVKMVQTFARQLTHTPLPHISPHSHAAEPRATALPPSNPRQLRCRSISSPQGADMEDTALLEWRALDRAQQVLRQRHRIFFSKMDALAQAEPLRRQVRAFCKRHHFSEADILAQANAMLLELPEYQRPVYKDWPVLHTVRNSSPDRQQNIRTAMQRHGMDITAKAVCLADYEKYWAKEIGFAAVQQFCRDGEHARIDVAFDTFQKGMRPTQDLRESVLEGSDHPERCREARAVLQTQYQALQLKFERYMAHLQLDGRGGNGYKPGHER